VLPSLFFTYLGQAAFLIHAPDAVQSVYYNSLPEPVYWPMFVIATLAAIVASQVNSNEQHRISYSDPMSSIGHATDGTLEESLGMDRNG